MTGFSEGRVSLYVKNIQDLKVIMEKVGKIRGSKKSTVWRTIKNSALWKL